MAKKIISSRGESGKTVNVKPTLTQRVTDLEATTAALCASNCQRACLDLGGHHWEYDHCNETLAGTRTFVFTCRCGARRFAWNDLTKIERKALQVLGLLKKD